MNQWYTSLLPLPQEKVYRPCSITILCKICPGEAHGTSSAHWTLLPCLFHLSLSLCWTQLVQWSTSPRSVWNSHATEMTIKRNWGVAVLFKPEYWTLDLDSQQVPACYNKTTKKIPKLSEHRWVYFWIQTCSLHVTSLKKQSPFLSILGIKSFLKALSDYIKHVGFWLKSLCQICRNAEAMPGALDSSQPRAVSLSASKNITFLGHL